MCWIHKYFLIHTYGGGGGDNKLFFMPCPALGVNLDKELFISKNQHIQTSIASQSRVLHIL